MSIIGSLKRKVLRVTSLQGHSFYPAVLGQDSVVVDLGSHLGAFSQGIHDRFGCRCYAVEASPLMFDKIVVGPGVTKHHFAACARRGPVEFHLSSSPDSSSIQKLPDHQHMRTVTVEGMPLETFIQEQQIKRVDLLKVDVEGAEIELMDGLTDARLRSIAQLSIEFHAFAGRTTKQDVVRILERLDNLGFCCVDYSRGTYFDTLCLNRDLCGLSRRDCWYFSHPVRRVRALF